MNSNIEEVIGEQLICPNCNSKLDINNFIKRKKSNEYLIKKIRLNVILSIVTLLLFCLKFFMSNNYDFLLYIPRIILEESYWLYILFIVFFVANIILKKKNIDLYNNNIVDTYLICDNCTSETNVNDFEINNSNSKINLSRLININTLQKIRKTKVHKAKNIFIVTYVLLNFLIIISLIIYYCITGVSGGFGDTEVKYGIHAIENALFPTMIIEYLVFPFNILLFIILNFTITKIAKKKDREYNDLTKIVVEDDFFKKNKE